MNIIFLGIAKLIAMMMGFGFGLFFFYMNIKGKFYDYPNWSNEEVMTSILMDVHLSFLPLIIILIIIK